MGICRFLTAKKISWERYKSKKEVVLSVQNTMYFHINTDMATFQFVRHGDGRKITNQSLKSALLAISTTLQVWYLAYQLRQDIGQ